MICLLAYLIFHIYGLLQGGDGVANHPNQWFQASIEYYKAKNGGLTDMKKEVI